MTIHVHVYVKDADVLKFNVKLKYLKGEFICYGVIAQTPDLAIEWVKQHMSLSLVRDEVTLEWVKKRSEIWEASSAPKGKVYKLSISGHGYLQVYATSANEAKNASFSARKG